MAIRIFLEGKLMIQHAMPDTWAAIDGLGRELPMSGEVPAPRTNRTVGIFYWTWHNDPHNPPMNNTQIFHAHPEALHDVNNPMWQGEFRSHHWDEPLFGYYMTTDRWVLRKHAELLADALVDVAIFDNTNGTTTWKESYTALMDTFAEARRDGVNAPSIAFLLPLFLDNPQNTRIQLRELYQDVYKADRHPELWFRWKGKPLIMAYPEAMNPQDALDREILDFFCFKPGQPSYLRGQERPDHWGWLSVYPQQVYLNADGTPEQITVGVAQNHSKELGLTAMNGENIFGRTYTSKGYDTRSDAKLRGANLAEQFEYALKVDPEFIFITGWNEWIATRHAQWQGVVNAFPDQFDESFSRDIEPCAGDLKDHYYYQLVSYIRQYKGVRSIPAASTQAQCDLGSAEVWSNIGITYGSYRGNTAHRDTDGYLTTHYTDYSGRNDIVCCAVRHDSTNIIFRVECDREITPPGEPGWMRLFLRVAAGAAGWEGFDYIVNRDKPGELEKSSGGWNWEKVCDVRSVLNGNALEIEIPRASLGLAHAPFELGFKWSDHMQNDGDPMDFYLHGDCAPGGRFTYVYRAND
jgi:hypothetical protein